MKILVIDDSKPIVTFIREVLTNIGMEVSSVENGLVACDFLKKNDGVDAILLDWNMPEMDGPAFLDAVKEQNLTTAPIIMMTTHNKQEDIRVVLEKGASEYIMKPFTEDILICKINMVTKNCEVC